jgi:hypothetical protein
MNPDSIPGPTTDINAVLAERGKRYGKFADHARIAMEIRAAIFSNRSRDMKPDQIEALTMIAHKLARILNGDPDYADSWRDIAGYATLVADRLEGVSR